MRTTVRLDDGLMAEVKRYAVNRRKTITAVIEQALRETIARREIRQQSTPVKFTTCSGLGPRPGIDIDNSAKLIDLMDEEDAPS